MKRYNRTTRKAQRIRKQNIVGSLLIALAFIVTIAMVGYTNTSNGAMAQCRLTQSQATCNHILNR